MVHIREVIREIMRNIVPVDESGDFVVTLFNTMQTKMVTFVDNFHSFE